MYLDGKELKYCPLKSLTPEVKRIVDLFAHYKNGFLPLGGGILNQPNKIMRSIQVILAVEGQLDSDKKGSGKKQKKPVEIKESNLGVKKK